MSYNVSLLKEQINTEVELLFQRFRISHGYKKNNSDIPRWKHPKEIQKLKSLIKSELMFETQCCQEQTYEIFLDDIRNPPENFQGVICRTAEEAIKLIKTGEVTFISFDHDLGTEMTGYDVAKFIEEEVYYGRIDCPKWKVHSANPVGAQNIKQAMMNAEQYELENH